MGVDYRLRCKKCHEASETLHELKKHDLAENIHDDYWLDWGTVNIERLIAWINEHKEHGEIEFTAE